MTIKTTKSLAIITSLLFILTVSKVSAQCGPDGTQACPKSPGSTKTKPKTTTSSSKTKPTPAKTTKPTKVTNKNPLFNKLLGTWDMGHGDTVTFFANGTGKGYGKEGLCVDIKFVLKGDILEVNLKAAGKCAEKGTTAGETEKMRIRFDENNNLRTRRFKPDGTEDIYEDSAQRIK